MKNKEKTYTQQLKNEQSESEEGLVINLEEFFEDDE